MKYSSVIDFSIITQCKTAGLATSRPGEPEAKEKAKAWNSNLTFKPSDFAVKTK